jgi:hypothetical protein
MSYADKIVRSVIGKGPKQPRVTGLRDVTKAQYRRSGKHLSKHGDFDRDGVRNWDDCYPFDSSRHMVHYGYFQVTYEDGSTGVEYGTSKRQVGSMLDAKGAAYLDIQEVSRTAATELAKGERGLKIARKGWHKSKKLIK